ncbi:MAG: GTPase ObgE [Bacillota bacterium]|nr:GTPase ObgE [Bacillota bacterium]
MFYDQAKIYVKGGDGGNGMVAFRREKYVPEGGPSGGDGGKGGNVIITTDPGLKTLVDFKYKRHYKADRGEHGQSKNCHGKSAGDLIIKVPLGTIVKDADTDEILADLVAEEQSYSVVKGGRGGRGNTRFTSAQNRVPTLAENGEPGEEKWVQLELKLLADVGLVGFPNAGKSTLIGRISAAKPKIGDYPFTTITPNLGVVSVGEGNSFVVADIPGLIEGAHTGVGLGHEFLRHVERTRLLLHIVDIAGTEGRDPVDDINIINSELQKYDERLAKRPQLLVANKIDVPGTEENIAKVQAAFPEQQLYAISAATGQGVDQLINEVAKLLETLVEEEPVIEEEEVRHVAFTDAPERFTIDVEDGVYIVSGKEIERHFAMTNFDNEASVRRFQNIIKVMGIEDALREAGAKEGDVVRIKDLEFDLID